MIRSYPSSQYKSLKYGSNADLSRIITPMASAEISSYFSRFSDPPFSITCLMRLALFKSILSQASSPPKAPSISALRSKRRSNTLLLSSVKSSPRSMQNSTNILFRWITRMNLIPGFTELMVIQWDGPGCPEILMPALSAFSKKVVQNDVFGFPTALRSRADLNSSIRQCCSPSPYVYFPSPISL